ncbi:MAG: uracil-DNA glycosylase [Spirochaetales bacterium]|nr:uracil-DNA glycosylase [Spirochaetales bacterium]
MKDRNSAIKKLMDFVYLFEDYLHSGYRRNHPEFELPPVDSTISPEVKMSENTKLTGIKKRIQTCTLCYLHYNRKNALAGGGSENPDIVIVGGGPNEEEDNAGEGFAGMAGNYLKKWIDAIHFSLPEQCFICNIVRCRSPQNREPRIEEIKSCLPYFDEQIMVLNPKVILALGRIPGQVLSGDFSKEVDELRNLSFDYKGIPLVITYHPDSVLQDSNLRKPVWEDLKKLSKIVEKRTGSQ